MANTSKVSIKEFYKCRWCDKEKAENKFYKCSIDNKTLICTDCITHKYNDVLQKTDKAKALLVCCHHLDIPFIYEIFNSLNVREGLGIYIRQLNLTQNRTENFEDGLINYVDLSVNPKEFIRDEVKIELRDLLKRMGETVNDL